MVDRSELVRILNELIKPGAKTQAIEKLARFLGLQTVLVFLSDPVASVPLAAPGFPQTLPMGKRWQNFLAECTPKKEIEAEMPWPTAESLAPCRAVGTSEGAIVVLVGDELHGEKIDELLVLLPLLTAALTSESSQAQQAAAASFAEDIARQAETLSVRLDESRRAVQKELQIRTAAEQMLRAREAELQSMVEALEQARGELQLHANQMEKRVAERTAKLSETVGELEAFSYSIAHDMRAPLRAMQGYASHLLEDYGAQLDSDALSALKKIGSSAIRLDRLIQDVLNYSRLVRHEFELTSVDLDPLVRSIIDSYPDWHAPQASVTIEGHLPGVRGNEAFLTQCISNLIGNAVKFVQPGTTPKVVISAEREGPKVILHVADNGIGFEKKDAERIFKIFERLHTRKEYDGTGIGLAIVRKAAERMGGFVSVKSQPGEGSTFSLHLEGTFL